MKDLYGSIFKGKFRVRDNEFFVIIEDVAKAFTHRACPYWMIEGKEYWVWFWEFLSTVVTNKTRGKVQDLRGCVLEKIDPEFVFCLLKGKFHCLCQTGGLIKP